MVVRYVGYEMAFQHLYRKQWIENKDDKGEIFALTALGKQEAETLKSFSLDSQEIIQNKLMGNSGECLTCRKYLEKMLDAVVHHDKIATLHKDEKN